MKLFTVLVLMLILSCNMNKKPFYTEAENANYEIQVMPWENYEDTNGSSAYKLRIYPKQKVLEEAGKQLEDVLWYQTDSCFYLTRDGIRIQPKLVQPVANGITSCFEYMLVFNDQNPSGRHSDLTFVFDDRHITREKYIVELL